MLFCRPGPQPTRIDVPARAKIISFLFLALLCSNVSKAQEVTYSYPIGPRNPGVFTQNNDGDGWYNAQDFREFNVDLGGYHAGEDWNAETGGNSDVGQPVYAIADGEVTLVREVFNQFNVSIGDVVVLKHLRPGQTTIYSLYLHIEADPLTVGSLLPRDQELGTIADLSAAGFFSHLHFEIRTSPVPQSGPLFPNAMPNGYYSTFASMITDGLTVDPSDFIDNERRGSTPGKNLAQCCLYVTDNGEEIDTFNCGIPGPLRGPNGEGDFWGLTFGPDGKLYICSNRFGPDRVIRLDPFDGAPCPGPLGSLDSADFVPPDEDRNGGLEGGRGLTFGPDGHLYVASIGTDEVLRFDGETGEFLDPFVSSRSGGLDDPTDLKFGPDGNLYVCCLRGGSNLTGSQVLVYDGVTGCFLRPLVRDDPATPFDETGGLREAWGIEFDDHDRVYLTSHHNHKVLRYDRFSGAAIDCFVNPGSGGLANPFGLSFGLDGDLFVTSDGGFDDDRILRFDGTTGAFKGVHVEVSGEAATYLAFRPPGLVTTPKLLVGLENEELSKSSSDPLTLCARMVNKPVPRRVLIFVWIEDPSHSIHPLGLPSNFDVCPPRPQQGSVPGGPGPLLSGNFDFATTIRLGTAGAGILDQVGSYRLGARVTDAITGLVYSHGTASFKIVP